MYCSVIGNDTLRRKIKEAADKLIVIAFIQSKCGYTCWEKITCQLQDLGHTYPDIYFIRAVVSHTTGFNKVHFLVIKDGVTLEEFTSNTGSVIPKILSKYISKSEITKKQSTKVI